MERYQLEYTNDRGEPIKRRFATESETRQYAALVNLVLHVEVTIYELVIK